MKWEEVPYWAPIVATFGGGVNSTALIAEGVTRGLRLDLILFADTGGERPETYAHVGAFSEWLVSRGYPPITIVRRVNEAGECITLEGELLKTKGLPGVAFGPKFKTCSQKFKIQPQDKFINHWLPAREAWGRNGWVAKIIGFDADEPGRADYSPDKKYKRLYPLIDWKWGRDECLEALKRLGISSPGKSSCFFCPNMQDWEIRQLYAQCPDLLDRAIAMEQNAKDNVDIKGLGRDFAWADLRRFFDNQMELPMEFKTAKEQCSPCYDGAETP